MAKMGATLNVQPRAQTMSPAVATMAKPAVQSSTFFFEVLVNITARKANENPAISALMKALCRKISAIISGERFSDLAPYAA